MKYLLILTLLFLGFTSQAQSTEDIRINASLGELHLIGMEKMTFASDQFVFKKAGGGMTIDNAVRVNGKLNAEAYFLNGRPLVETLTLNSQALNFGSVFKFPESTLTVADFSSYVTRYQKLPRLSANTQELSLLALNQKLIWQTEELSLYIIELHQELELLKKKIAQLESN
ncbi:MAG: hypothetical protein ACPGJS_19285 [Flammeovirgaceae bacterium]